MSKYYDKNGLINKKAFDEEIKKINDVIGEGLDKDGLLKVRRRLYYLKSKYEESGSRNLEIEAVIKCVNELLE